MPPKTEGREDLKAGSCSSGLGFGVLIAVGAAVGTAGTVPSSLNTRLTLLFRRSIIGSKLTNS
jgi:hypothetical protein